MNRFAYLTTGFAIKALSSLTKAHIDIHGKENLPGGAIIYAINHFTRIETLILPLCIYELGDNTPVWSIADYSLFKGALKTYLDRVGAVSTRDPDRDLLVVKSLLSGTASWIIFPEGRMVKNKKIIDRGRFMITTESGKREPHTGAAALALRTEFYRQRIKACRNLLPDEAERLMRLFEIDDPRSVTEGATYIVPVNVTYYPLRARENIISRMAQYFVENLPERAVEEIMTEGMMLLDGVDVDIRFGKPIDIREHLKTTDYLREIEDPGETDIDRLEKYFRKSAARIMREYMTAIYRMTTVNHDHLFASFLKEMPYSKITLDDLRRRVYLLTTLRLDQMGIFLHRSFREDQTHLLTDDRYRKTEDFVSVAVEKKILLPSENHYVRNKALLSTGMAFHKIRIDNPVSVMANEVEPLSLLQHHIRPLAWLPEFWIKRRTVRHLVRAAREEYERDWETFYVAGESKPKTIGAPFMLKRRSSRTGILLIHGYMAAPVEVAGLANYLARKEINVYVPRLKGHGTSPEDLATRSHRDWIRSVEEGYAVVRSMSDRVFVAGFSTGAALALEIAARIESLAGVIVICSPRRLQDASLKKNLAVDIWKRLVERVKGNDDKKKEYIDNVPENPEISYLKNPVSGIREVELLMEHLDRNLDRIRQPTLVIHSRKDPIANPDESRRIFEMIGAEDKQYILFNYDRHALLSGGEARRVYRTIGDFMDSILEIR